MTDCFSPSVSEPSPLWRSYQRSPSPPAGRWFCHPWLDSWSEPCSPISARCKRVKPKKTWISQPTTLSGQGISINYFFGKKCAVKEIIQRILNMDLTDYNLKKKKSKACFVFQKLQDGSQNLASCGVKYWRAKEQCQQRHFNSKKCYPFNSSWCAQRFYRLAK